MSFPAVAAASSDAPLPATSLSIVVQRHKANPQQVQFAVTAQIPRKRTSVDDPCVNTLQYYQFLDDRRNFSHLDALLTRLAPLNVVHLVCTEKAEASKKDTSGKSERNAKQIRALLEKIETSIACRDDLMETNNSDEATSSLTSIYPALPSGVDTLDDTLEHLLNETSFLQYRGLVVEHLSKQSLHFLLSSQGLTARTDMHLNSCELQPGHLSSHLLLDRTASECIHLLPPAHAGLATLVGGQKHNNSLYGILNQTHSPMGSRLLQIWLRQPLVQLEPLQRRQNAVTTLLDDSMLRDRIRQEGLKATFDLDALAARLGSYQEGLNGSTRMALETIYKVYMLGTKHLPQLVEALQGLSDEQQQEGGLLMDSKTGLEKVLANLIQATNLVQEVLDLDEAPREFLIKASLDERLSEAREELDEIQAQLEALHEEMNVIWQEETGQKGQVRLEQDDWQFRLPNTNDVKTLQGSLQGSVEVHKMLKNGVYFSTKALRELARNKQDVMDRIEEAQHQVVDQACKVAATYTPVVERASALIAELDVICSFAHVAAFSPNGYCKPELTDGEEDGLGIVLKDARHPCVELQDNVMFIPNDISLVFGESAFCLVTGPNMGGKSTYIRSLAAIVTMAQIGSYVPCTSAKVNLVHHILARVGAGDAQNRGISTFMAEMLESSSILSKATKRSLIIVDELGRGTSTYDGYGLASAISEHLIESVGCATVFATHFHELTALEEKHPNAVKNRHVTAHMDPNQGLTFMYQVQDGPCLQSFGIDVAEMAQVPKSVVADARRRAKELEGFDVSRKRTVPQERLLSKFRKLDMDKFGSVEEKWVALREMVKEYKESGDQ